MLDVKIRSFVAMCANKCCFIVQLGKSELKLAVLGLERSDASLAWKRDGRAFSMVDTEHWLCKLCVLVSHVHASRCFSVQPFATKPHCWPVRTKLKWKKHNEDYFKDIVTSLEKLLELTFSEKERDDDCLVYPDRVLLRKEEKLWDFYGLVSRAKKIVPVEQHPQREEEPVLPVPEANAKKSNVGCQSPKLTAIAKVFASRKSSSGRGKRAMAAAGGETTVSSTRRSQRTKKARHT